MNMVTDPLAAGFWGAFFGTVGLMWVGSAVAFRQSLRSVSSNMALSSLLAALFVAVYLGWVTLGDARADLRLKTHVAIISSCVLAYLLLWMLGLMRDRAFRRRAGVGLLGLAVLLLLGSWAMPPRLGLIIGSVAACALAALGVALCARNALRGDRPAWSALVAVTFMLVAIGGLSWIALFGPEVSWLVHALSALAGIAFVATMASVLWRRYAYLVELHQILTIGPSYDPVTRMRSHSETGQMVGAAFRQHRQRHAPMGMIAISIANFYALEQLHGRAAVNHALFVCAGRLRECVPARVETGRIAEDGFLLLWPDCHDGTRLLALARRVVARLARPVVLSTAPASGEMDNRRTAWAADVGLGVLLVDDPAANPAQSVGTARAMSRTAWSYASRIAWFDEFDNQITELAPDEGEPAAGKGARIIGAPAR